VQVAGEALKSEPVGKPVDEKIPEPVAINIDLPKMMKPQSPVHEVREGWFEKWLRHNPDIEKFIGENLINKIGIAVLILGIAFFVKYAIDQNG
jgi:uncharacterized membrane protein